MDFGKALTYQFRDPDWLQKILLTSLISVIPVLGWLVVFGWSLEITRRVVIDDSEPLPGLDVINDLVRGIKGLVINLVYSLPLVIILVPVAVMIGLTTLASDSQVITGVNLVSALCLVGISFFYGIFLMFILPAAYCNLVATDGLLGAALNLKAVFHTVKTAPSAFLLVMIGQLLSAFIASFGAVACVIGIIVTTTYTFSIMGHLYGQAYREAQLVRNLPLSK